MADLNTPMEVDESTVSKDSEKHVNIVPEWLEKFKSDTLNEIDFRKYWKYWVARLLKPEIHVSSLEWSFNEQKTEKILFNTLEEFICDGNSIEVLRGLTQQNYPPSVCGRVFKMGEPTYNCRECGMDSTCVLCVDCFKKSSHKNHKYKMGTSYGGGCCDCGDVEAWKQDAYCQTHKLGLEKKHDNINILTIDMEARARLIFEYVLRYARSLLTLEHPPMLPVELDSEDIADDLYSIYNNQEDSFCTVLYNDETHTFDQVITTLTRFIKCPQRESIDYVTSIDREGRAVVKCAGFLHCKDLKEEIEKYTSRHGGKPLKTVVVHSHVIAHQIYALRLLTWMQNLLGYSERLRAVFSEVVLTPKLSESCIVESILRKDTALWKSARLHWHKLFIAGMFIEYNNKKEFAKVFTKNYGAIMKDFINDDHDYSYSVVSLGVQIFTVPTLANYLMAHHDVLYQLLNTFLSECSHKVNKQGKLEFERNTSTMPFKRAQQVLGDIRYLLGFVPDKWNPELRVSFCHAVSLVLKILNYMQNMDTVTRQVGQHMEYEPEWETAFNLHIKLRPLITKILLWCGSDCLVLKKVYRMTLKKIWENPIVDPNRPTVVKELIDRSVTCIDYDVSTEPVSIHLPLSRFLAGLHLYLDRYGLSFDHPDLQTARQTPEQIIEPVLRAQVLISQVHAGMWRRNGYSLLNQIYLYHNAKCRMEMLDKDIVLLQMGASLIDSNEFLIHVLNKFNLLKWAQPNFELNLLNGTEDESIRQTISLVEEFLTLIITIVGERYTPGIGQVSFDDCIKKEVIQQLCVEPMPHSELNKTLLHIVDDEECLEKVINEVAVFKKTRGKGVYELKEKFYDDYNVFFYHYSREDMSKSEEEQRRRRKTAGELECCPPPSLPLFSDAFKSVANILQCDIMFYIMKLILDRTVNLRSRSFSESQLHKVLHLIGYALHEEEKQSNSSFNFTERSELYGLEGALDDLRKSPRVEAYKDLSVWTLNKFRQVSAPRRKGKKTVEVEKMDDDKIEDADLEKQKRAKLAAERRAAVMAQMAQMQSNFMKDNATLFENTPTYSESYQDSINMDILENIGELSVALGPYQTISSTFDNRYTCILCQEEQIVTHDSQAMVLATFVQKSSVLCQVRCNPETFIDNTPDPYYIPANFGPSPHISTCGHVMHVACWQKHFDMILAKENRRPYRLRHSLSFDVHKNEYLCPLCEGLCNAVIPLLPPISSFTEPENMKTFENLSFENWLEGLNMALKQSKVARPNNTSQEKATSESTSSTRLSTSPDIEPERQRRIPARRDALMQQHAVANLVAGNNLGQIIVIRDSGEFQPDDEDEEEEVLPPPNQFSIGTNDFIMQILMFDKSSPTSVPKVSIYKNSELSTSLVDTILKFAHSTYSKGTGVNPHPDNNQIPLMTWKACAYTIHSIEVILRYKNKPLLGDLCCRQKDCLEALVRISAVLSSTWKKEHEINLHALRLLSLAIDNGGNNSIGILDWDAFGMLVSLTMTLPSLYYTEVPGPAPRGTMLDLHTLLLMFIVNIVQIILTIDINEETENVLEIDLEEAKDTACIAKLVSKLRGINIKNTVAIWNKLEIFSTPFLRCCTLFYHFLTGVPASGVLTEVKGDTYHNMCCYLGLPTTCRELLDKPFVEVLINKWITNDKIVKIRNGEKIPFKNWTQVNELVQLPDDYSELINTVSMFTCPNSDHEDSRNPTMCLVCGAMLCSQSYCCQTELKRLLVGACSSHAYTCGCGVGIFLRVRECEVLLLASPNKGCFITPPYLDEYGETDQGLKRGNPLFLCKDQYRKLQILWLGHGLHEEISRYLDSTHNLIPTTWQHM
ncbi:E3 ubiquitin-protein ligase UBR2 [Daktulosphaira vitifoliae]|uniref:E3 ubiquitin-protein ligase UBR2 n=1 Tax=Daktulosphaira vitifoliae TaxID=58002 RepID=UPI0021AA9D6C|nr:E3 ubiquitin-protein ligase UBR2 [Daktulosphaira vitifoliae]XP_050524887.1 E3 ubiquitin-protein ligase UBR2 [Daktulosphaira vitifoliae]XP_050524888.1 E3 ubiquitin-protein ligase UBR2 [Daktulosphaira vitifoliae]